DRASTFADPEIVALLKTRFVPVAINQALQRRQQDTEGEFYRKIAGQGPRNDFNSTTQGFYIATAAGNLLLYNNNRDPDKVRRLMQQKLTEFASSASSTSGVAEIRAEKVDPQYNVSPPPGGLVLRVRAKVLDGYEPTEDQWQQIFQSALSRDNLWVSADEHKALVRGELPASLQQRIARFHLVDNARGEPPMWKPEEIRKLDVKLDRGELNGVAQLATGRGDRGYEAALKGFVEVKDGAVVRFDMVALGEFWGEGPFTQGAPKGKFPLAISFTLADGTDVADRIPPQGSRGWLRGYLQ
ncbi:MAG: hypothetical protein ABI614_29320, partial [Planctomycetota bacterium]